MLIDHPNHPRTPGSLNVGHDPPSIVLHFAPHRLVVDEFQTQGGCGAITIVTITRPEHGDRPTQVENTLCLPVSRQAFLASLHAEC